MSGTGNLQEQRRRLFRAVGQRMVADLDLAAEGATDSGLQGVSAEAAFRRWLQEQLPRRYVVASGAVLTAATPPTTQRDCLVFDEVDCAPFRTLGAEPDLFPIEGVVAAVEVNTGRSGATREKILHDAGKLTEIGEVFARHRCGVLPKVQRLDPCLILGVPTVNAPVWVSNQGFSLPPLKLLFAESIRGSLGDYAEAVATHNLTTRLGAAIDGLFVLDQGFALHLMEEGWAHHRIPGTPFASCLAEPWAVLLKLMTVLWSHLWKGPHASPDLGPYYADRRFFDEEEKPRAVIVTGADYVAQVEENFVAAGGPPKPIQGRP